MGSKLKAQRVHAKRRAWERHNLSLGRRELAHLARMVQRGNGVFVRRESGRVSIWRLHFDGRMLWIVYDKSRKAIVTFLNG